MSAGCGKAEKTKIVISIDIADRFGRVWASI